MDDVTETVPTRQIRAGDYVIDPDIDEWCRVWCVEQYGPCAVCTDQSADVIRQIKYGETVERIPAEEADDGC